MGRRITEVVIEDTQATRDGRPELLIQLLKGLILNKLKIKKAIYSSLYRNMKHAYCNIEFSINADSLAYLCWCSCPPSQLSIDNGHKANDIYCHLYTNVHSNLINSAIDMLHWYILVYGTKYIPINVALCCCWIECSWNYYSHTHEL